MAKEGEPSAKKVDDLDAVRIVTETLEGFKPEERDRILRWACERLGVNPLAHTSSRPVVTTGHEAGPPSTTAPIHRGARDIKTFIDEKDPKTDVQFATAIAYFYKFEAPENERREEIDATFLRDACRRAGRPGKLVKPLKTLNNAQARGFLDRAERGTFVINSVGENLVGMTLPAGDSGRSRARTRKARKQAKKSAPKKSL